MSEDSQDINIDYKIELLTQIKILNNFKGSFQKGISPEIHHAIETIEAFPSQKLGSYEKEKKYIEAIGEILVVVVPVLCQMFIDSGENLYNNRNTDNAFNVFQKITNIFHNYTAATDTLTVELCNKPNFMEFLKRMLEVAVKSYATNDENKFLYTIIQSCLVIIHNCSNVSTNWMCLRHLKLTEVLLPCMEAKNEDIQLISFCTLMQLISEKETGDQLEKIITKIPLMMKYSKAALKNQQLRHDGFSILDCAKVLSKLSQREATRKVLTKCDITELLLDLIEKGTSRENIETTNALWNLAEERVFLEKLHKQEEFIQKLQQIQRDTKTDLKDSTSTDAKINQNVTHLLESLNQSTESPSVGREDTTKSLESHIMISYQHNNKKIVHRIRMALHNYNVWINEKKMHSNLNENMVKAVENADIFLMCVSHDYQFSLICKKEATYADTKKKKIIPLVVEAGYEQVADGWLGNLMEDLKHIDFSEKADFDKSIKSLKKEIEQTEIKPNKRVEHPKMARMPLCISTTPAPAKFKRMSGSNEADQIMQLTRGFEITIRQRVAKHLTIFLKDD